MQFSVAINKAWQKLSKMRSILKSSILVDNKKVHTDLALYNLISASLTLYLLENCEGVIILLRKIPGRKLSRNMSNARFSKPLWHLIDARNQIVGRLATQIVSILRGKHKPSFSPQWDCGDYVVVINAKDVKFTGAKVADKQYTWHTGYPGGLKQITVKEQLDKKPEEVLRKAVLGMLAKNTMRYRIARKLRIFPGNSHLHEDKLPPAATKSII